jgi:hypothetical protein
MMAVPAGGLRVKAIGRENEGLGKLYALIRPVNGTSPSPAAAAYVPGVTPPEAVKRVKFAGSYRMKLSPC